jgi:small subunit ribosomal protein S16
MVKIRLSRTGRKNNPSYRVVITNNREKRDSKAIELVGYYLPKQKQIELNAERINYWLSVGAQPTDTVRSLLIRKEILKASKNKKTYAKKPGKKSEERKAKKAEAASAA